MQDRAMIIRRQMEMTTRNLTQKLEALEQQVTEQVQSAGTTVNATAEAVQDVVHSVGKAFDMDRQFRRHPWLFIGGSVLLGYIGTKLLQEDASSSPIGRPARHNNAASRSEKNHGGNNHDKSDIAGNGQSANQTASAQFSAPFTTGQSDDECVDSTGTTVSEELRRVAVETFSGIAQELIARSIPQIISYFRDDPAAKEQTQEGRSNSVKPEHA